MFRIAQVAANYSSLTIFTPSTTLKFMAFMSNFFAITRGLAIFSYLLFGARFAWSDEIQIGLRPIAPYVVVDANKKFTGLEFEIISAALAAVGHTIKAVAMPMSRLLLTFEAGKLQAAAPILVSTNSGATLSDVYLSYNNIVMSLKTSHLNIATVRDLKDVSIVAFQTATKALGPQYAAIIALNKNYSEVAQQIIQIRMLFTNRVNVIIGDSRILNYLIKSPDSQVDSSVATQEFWIFPPTNYRVAFRNPIYAADFNRGLALIKKNGSYNRILAKYKN